MCVYSMIGDAFDDSWKRKYPNQPIMPNTGGSASNIFHWPDPKAIEAIRKDIDYVKKELELLKDLLKRAIKYDEKMNQPECEMEQKIEAIRKVAEIAGVDLSDVLPKKDNAG